MNEDTPSAASAATSQDFPTTGWTMKGLRIGRMYADSVHIHDTKGAHHFREFMGTAFDLTKRKRHNPGATRYLEELTNAEAPLLLSEEAADYLADMKKRNLSRTTQYSQKHHFRLLLLAAGDIMVSRINSTHIREFWDILRWWPADASSALKFKGMTDADILAYGKASNREPRADTTLDLAKIQLTAFFNGLLSRKVIGSSPMVGFRKPKKSLVSTPKRRGFKAEEISKLFDHKTYLPWAKKNPHSWWSPMIGLYTGARIGEIAQLKVADIIENCGVWCFSIQVTEDEDGGVTQGLKGASAIRIVPIAQPLLDAGILDFLADARESGHARLFPQLKLGCVRDSQERNGSGYGQALSRKFSPHLRRQMPLEKGLGFHCFRHSFITELHIKKIEPRVIASITGHTPKTNGQALQVFPVMEAHYTHIPESIIRPEQVAALACYEPPVVLPKYKRGQFAHSFGPNAKKNP